MREFGQRVLFLAGTTLLAAAVIYGAPTAPARRDSGSEQTPVRIASAADLGAMVTPFRVTLKRKPARQTDTVKPNGASCPDANTASLMPPASDQSADSDVQNSSAIPPMPNGKVASPWPPTGSDVRADIARGHALARPEPLNSKQLIAPIAKAPG